MLSIPWNNVTGWGQARIEPRKDITVDPLSGVMQYAATCFEGMKVSYREPRKSKEPP
jgi:branched-chain amino acid aminotransferase